MGAGAPGQDESHIRLSLFTLCDESLGAEHQAGPTTGFGSAPLEPPSVHAFMSTHRGSLSFTNLTATEVTIDGHRALVFGVFIPQEGPAETRRGS